MPQTDFSQAPGLQAAIRTGVHSELKKQRSTGEEVTESGKARGRGKRGQALNPEA